MLEEVLCAGKDVGNGFFEPELYNELDDLAAVSAIIAQERVPFWHCVGILHEKQISGICGILRQILVAYESRAAHFKERPDQWRDQLTVAQHPVAQDPGPGHENRNRNHETLTLDDKHKQSQKVRLRSVGWQLRKLALKVFANRRQHLDAR